MKKIITLSLIFLSGVVMAQDSGYVSSRNFGVNSDKRIDRDVSQPSNPVRGNNNFSDAYIADLANALLDVGYLNREYDKKFADARNEEELKRLEIQKYQEETRLVNRYGFRTIEDFDDASVEVSINPILREKISSKIEEIIIVRSGILEKIAQ